MEEEAPNIMDLYNLNLSSSDAENTASDCDSDNGRSNVIVEAIYNVKRQKQSETLLKFKSHDDLMGCVKTTDTPNENSNLSKSDTKPDAASYCDSENELGTSMIEKTPVKSIPGKFIAYRSCPLHFSLTF